MAKAMPCGLCYLRIRGPDLFPQPRADKAEHDDHNRAHPQRRYPDIQKTNPFAIGPIVWFGFSEVAANNAFALGRLGTLNEAAARAHAAYVAPASAGLVCRSSRAQSMPSAMITTALASKVGTLPTFRMPNP